jgi:hypothetical protein
MNYDILSQKHIVEVTQKRLGNYETKHFETEMNMKVLEGIEKTDTPEYENMVAQKTQLESAIEITKKLLEDFKKKLPTEG